MPLLRDLYVNGGYKSVVSSKNKPAGSGGGVLSDFNVTGGFSRQHEDGAFLQMDDDELNRSQVQVSYDTSIVL